MSPLVLHFLSSPQDQHPFTPARSRPSSWEHCQSVFLKLNLPSQSSLLFLWPGLGQNESVRIKIFLIQLSWVCLYVYVCYCYLFVAEQGKKLAYFTAHSIIWFSISV